MSDGICERFAGHDFRKFIISVEFSQKGAKTKVLNCNEPKTCRKTLDNLLRQVYDMKHRGNGVTKSFLHAVPLFLFIPKNSNSNDAADAKSILRRFLFGGDALWFAVIYIRTDL